MPFSEERWTWQCDEMIPSDVVAGRRLLEEILHRLRAMHWPRRDVFGVHLATDEALANAIIHGNASDSRKHVRFSCRLSPRKIHIEIVDEGDGFDPNALPDPTTPAHHSCPTGRGVMLMKAFMSHVDFQEGGRRVVMEKHREAD